MSKSVHVILNPAAGKPEPILYLLNKHLHASGVQWDISVTHETGDVGRLVNKHKKKYDTIAVYGGDGTVMEAAEALFKTTIPLAILPGGTANVMAKELQIPVDVERAIQLLVDTKSSVKRIDMGVMNKKPFLIRINVGIMADIVTDATREMKDVLGRVAYGVSGIKNLSNDKISTYTLTLDGKEVVTHGVSLVVANAGNIGVEGKALVPNIKVTDGLLDVILMKEVSLPSLLELARASLLEHQPSSYIKRWKVKKVVVKSKIPLEIIKDDVPHTVRTFSAQIHEKSLSILCP